MKNVIMFLCAVFALTFVGCASTNVGAPKQSFDTAMRLRGLEQLQVFQAVAFDLVIAQLAAQGITAKVELTEYDFFDAYHLAFATFVIDTTKGDNHERGHIFVVFGRTNTTDGWTVIYNFSRQG